MKRLKMLSLLLLFLYIPVYSVHFMLCYTFLDDKFYDDDSLRNNIFCICVKNMGVYKFSHKRTDNMTQLFGAYNETIKTIFFMDKNSKMLLIEYIDSSESNEIPEFKKELDIACGRKGEVDLF